MCVVFKNGLQVLVTAGDLHKLHHFWITENHLFNFLALVLFVWGLLTGFDQLFDDFQVLFFSVIVWDVGGDFDDFCDSLGPFVIGIHLSESVVFDEFWEIGGILIFDFIVVAIIDKKIEITLNFILTLEQQRNLLLEVPQDDVVLSWRRMLELGVKTGESSIGDIEQEGLGWGCNP